MDIRIGFIGCGRVPEMLTGIEDSIKAFEAQNPNIKIKETRVNWSDAASQNA